MMKTGITKTLLTLKNNASVVAFSTLRGIDASESAAPYSGVSLCDYTGDAPERIACYESLLQQSLMQMLKVDRRPPILWARQRHTDRVAVVDSPSATRCDLPDGVDALVCTVPGVVVGVHTADCVPVLLYDAEARLVAAVHAGWRGVVAEIVPKCIAVMESLGASTARICAVIGPAICDRCYEVGHEVASNFPPQAVSVIDGREHVDLPSAVVMQLLECGLRRDSLQASGECTRCHPDRYFSARRLGVASGRVFTGIMLR